MKKVITISTITCAFNEQNTIAETINRIKKYPLSKNFQKEIIVVNNGSTDQTGNILKKIKDIKLINIKKNKGKGDGIIRALKYVTGDIVVIQDADLEYQPNNIPKLIKPILDNKTKVVFGSRIKRKRPIYLSAAYYYGNLLITHVFNLLYNQKLTDISTAHKAFTKKTILDFKLTSSDFGFDFESSIKAAKSNIKIHEVSVSYEPRSFEEGKKITPLDGLKALYIILKSRIID